MKTIKIRVDCATAIHGIKKNATVCIDVDKDGVPLDRLWRRRLHDAKIDNCISIVDEAPIKLETSTTTTNLKKGGK